jgi:hypothetical protein
MDSKRPSSTVTELKKSPSIGDYQNIIFTNPVKSDTDVYSANLDHYKNTHIVTELARLKNNLDEYIKNFPSPTKYAASKLSFLSYIGLSKDNHEPMNKAIGKAISWLPGLSYVGVRTNQPYAEKARDIILYALCHTDSNRNYYILTALEKILSLYLSTSSQTVSLHIQNAFKAILNIDMPKDANSFMKLKENFKTHLEIKTPSRETKLVEDDSISPPSTMTPADYRLLQQTWMSVHLVYDQPHASPYVNAPCS